MNERDRFLNKLSVVAQASRLVASRRRGRRYFVITVAAWCVCALTIWLPCSDGRALVDVDAGTAGAVGTAMDAVGIVHYVSDDRIQIVQPGNIVEADSGPLILVALAAAFAACLLWSVLYEHSVLLLAAMLLGAVVAVLFANGMFLFSAATAYSVVGIDLSRGFLGLLARLPQACFIVGLLYAQAKGIGWAAECWGNWLRRRAVSVAQDWPTQTDRRRERIAAGFLATIPVAIVLWAYGFGIPEDTIISSYRNTADVSLADGETAVAAVAVERLLRLDAAAPTHQLLRARYLAAEGKLDEAERIGLRIMDSGGRYAEPARRWLTELRLRRTSANSIAGSSIVEGAGRTTDPPDQETTSADRRLALAGDYLARGLTVPAIHELEQIVDDCPEERLTLARLLVVTGEQERARVQGRAAREYYQQQLDQSPLSETPRLKLASCYTFLEEFPKAVAVLSRGWELTQESCYREALARTYVVWHDNAERSGRPPAMCLRLLEKSLEYVPENAQALKRVAVTATQEGRAGPAIDLLTRALDGRPIPACVHCVLGTNAFAHGRVNNAVQHLEEAYRIDPENVETLNNLAWALAHADPPNLDRALRLAEDAVQRNPRLASCLETRGQILAKLGRWERAVADLEAVTSVMPNSASVHAALADAYEHLGDESLAAEHRRVAADERQVR